MEEYKSKIQIGDSEKVVDGLKEIANGLAEIQGLTKKKTEINIKANFKEITDLTKIAKEELLSYFDAFNKQGRSRYFAEEKEMIQNVQKAFDEYKKDVTDKKAESQLMIWSRAYEAMYGSLEKILPEADKLQKLLWNNPDKSNGRIQYTIESFKDLFAVMKEMSNRGFDMKEFTQSMVNGVNSVRKKVKSQGYVVTSEDLIDDGGIEQAIKRVEKQLSTYKEQLNKIRELQDEQDRLTNIVDNPDKAGKYNTKELDAFKAKILSLGDQINELQSSFDEDAFGINVTSLIEDITKLEKYYQSIGKKLPDFFVNLRKNAIHSIFQNNDRENAKEIIRRFIGFGEEDADKYISRIMGRIRRAKEAEIRANTENVSPTRERLNNKIKRNTQEGGVTTTQSDLEDFFNDIENEAKEAEGQAEKAGKQIKESFDAKNIEPLTNVLKEIADYLKTIRETLGSVDESAGFNNIIGSVEILLGKLDEMYQKIGTGINNIVVNKTSEVGSGGEVLVSKERDRLLRAYNKVIKSFGGESYAFSSMGQILPSNYGENLTEQFNTLYNSSSINKITNMTEQINRLRSFFGKINEYKKELAEQLEVQKRIVRELEADLNDNPLDMDVFEALTNAQVIKNNLQSDFNRISKFKIPSSENTGLNKKLDELNQKEFDIAELEDDKVMLKNIITELETIRDLISEISKKDFFNESLTKLLTQLDTITKKIQELSDNINITNQQKINDAFSDEQNTVDKAVNDEKATISTLSGAIDKVTKAVERKSNAFKQEAETVKNVVEEEKGYLKDLESSLDNVSEKIADKSKKGTNIGATDQIDYNNVGSAQNKKNRYDFGIIRHVGTGEEISQEAYDVLYKLKHHMELSITEMQVIPEVAEGYRHLAKNVNDFKDKYSYLNQSLNGTIDLQTKEREALREHILKIREESGSFSGKDKNGNDVYTGNVRKENKAVIVTGLPASGKSSSLVNPLSQYFGAKVLDSDIIKQLLPEFDNGWGADLVHKESGDLNRKLLKRVIGNKDEITDNLILPIVGDSVEKVDEYIKTLTAAGYDVQVMTNELSNDEASMRNILRFFSDNRFLEPKFVREYGDKPSEVYEKLKGNNNISGLYKYNNDVKKGKRPELVESNLTDAELVKYLRDYISPKSDEEDNISNLQNEIKIINQLLDKRSQLIALRDEYDKGSDEYNKITDDINRVTKKLNTFDNINFPLESETKAFNKLEESAKSSAEAKDAVTDANEGVASSTKPTETAVESEISSLDNLADSAKKTAEAKKEVADANEELAKSENKSKNKQTSKGDKGSDEREDNIKRYIDLLNKRNKLEAENLSKGKYGKNEVRDKELDSINEEIKGYEKLNFSKEESERIERETAKSRKALIDAENMAATSSEQQDDRNAKSLLRYKNSIDDAISSLDTLAAKKQYVSNFTDEINELRNTLNTMKGSAENIDVVTDEELQQLAEAILKLRELSRQASLAENKAANENTVQKSLAKINKVLSQNTKGTFRRSSLYQDYLDLQEAFKNFDTSKPQSEINELTTRLLQLDARFKELDNTVTGTGFFGNFLHRLSDMNAKFIAQYFSFQDIIRYARQAAQSIIELNDAFIELSKVSNTSIKELESDFQSYADIAKDIGGTISDTISATADWARMGYSVPDSKQLAEVAMLYKNVGDGIDISQANESLISTLQGYQMQADEAEHIVDVFNEVYS